MRYRLLDWYSDRVLDLYSWGVRVEIASSGWRYAVLGWIVDRILEPWSDAAIAAFTEEAKK